MPLLELITILDLTGTFVFALSGALVASKKDMDILGSLVLAVVTAAGGGTLRSMLIGDLPVPFLKDPLYLILCILAVLVVFCFKSHLHKLEKPIIILDAIGLGIFVSIGISVALGKDMNWWASLLMGIITGSFGGVIRDVLSNEIPLIFQKEIYATACLAGGLLFLLLTKLNLQSELVVYLSALLVFAVRLVAVKYKWDLPKC
ncbi:MAG: trimeric intracellular cation channel family protein [Candidatus Caenarcaniphilales bacterium]|nr:trimeric intracellular cation channel family protein [Candidatus Caenarcaniphilales bacterium]